MTATVEAIRREVENQAQFVGRLRSAIAGVIVGQQYMVDRLLAGVLANGHVLIEGVPGLAKTTAVKSLAQAMQCAFCRIQFTPDLLPADLIGTLVYSPKDGEFTTKKGPIFGNIILADEINRAPAKVQSALLEAMQERQVTIGETTFPLPDPFMVLATQNPIEQEGTYPLPEAQMDRFMLKLKVTYPSKGEEREIMDRVNLLHEPVLKPVVSQQEILQAREIVNHIYVDDKAKNYIVDIVQATRNPEVFGLPISHLIEYGASPRATIYLQQAARALAFLQGEGNVFPNDIKQIAMDVLRHRVIVTYEAEAENMSSEDVIRQILDTVPVPQTEAIMVHGTDTAQALAEWRDGRYLRMEQYRDSSNLDARASLHARFGTHGQSWFRWVFDRLALAEGSRVLEVGCGRGQLWAENLERIPAGVEVTLTDLSIGMMNGP